MFIIPKEGINVRLRQTKQLIKTNNDVTIMGLVNDLSSYFFYDDLQYLYTRELNDLQNVYNLCIRNLLLFNQHMIE